MSLVSGLSLIFELQVCIYFSPFHFSSNIDLLIWVTDDIFLDHDLQTMPEIVVLS